MSAPRIRSLPPGVVEVIAAGEVVERPASVVKELVENALDAGARRVAVHLEGGGRDLVRVEDDGEGMGPEDLALAFAPHATSKIRSVEDLDRVASYGFRGEALASIGAVADASVTSRARGARDAFRVEDRRGARGEPAPAAHPEGTTVEVRGLFASLPARRKFLRSAETEAARCVEVVVRFALGRPDAGFTLVADGRTLLRAPPGESAGERAARALGADAASRLLPVAGGRGATKVQGFLASPEDASAGRPPQYLSVNGRAVADRVVSHAVNEALSGLVPTGRRPAWVLAVTVPPGEVDVNCHPAKSEVRFRRPREVHEAVLHAVRDALLRGERAPPALPASREEAIRDALGDYLGRAPATGAPAAPPGPGLFGGAREGAAPPPRAGSAAEPAGPVLQVRHAFLVFEDGDGIAVVDQHALHERVLLERLRARLAAGGVAVQRLLVPEILEAGPADAARVAAAAGPLARAGVLLEPFGPGAVALHGVPAVLQGRPARRVALAVLAHLREETPGAGHGAPLDGLLETMACHAAVRAGDPLGQGEAAALLAEGRGLASGGRCAHGRPTELRIPFADLERRFHRT